MQKAFRQCTHVNLDLKSWNIENKNFEIKLKITWVLLVSGKVKSRVESYSKTRREMIKQTDVAEVYRLEMELDILAESNMQKWVIM